MAKNKGPRVLLLDIETAPMLGWFWGLFDQNIRLDMIKSDWYIISFAAKWLGAPPSKVVYRDSRGKKNIEDDRHLLNAAWTLLDEADIVIWQNGKNFDFKKLNARFILNGMQPPSTFKQIDTLQIARKIFAFTSNKLAYLSDKLNKKYKKQEHKKFPGFEMWRECLAGNLKAWQAMEEYNRYDVLALEETYNRLIPWDSTINFTLWTDGNSPVCTCGSKDFIRKGFFFSPKGKFQRYRCKKCGKENRSSVNEFSQVKRKALRVGTVR